LDMAIIDIGLRGAIDGVQVAEQFKEALIPIIFSTARQDTDTFERAQAVEPLAYLVKPFDKLTLHSCLDQAIRLKEAAESEKMEETAIQANDFFKDYFFIRSRGSLHKIKFDDIDYIQSDRNYSIIHAKGHKFAAKISLNNLIQKLPVAKFIRVHQSYIVSFSKVDKINVNEETISIAEVALPMGKTYKSTLMKRINRI
jgi:two-component system response regulator LytT